MREDAVGCEPAEGQEEERDRERRCTICGRQDAVTMTGWQTCALCRERSLSQRQKRVARYLSERRCKVCGRQDERTLSGRSRCDVCRQKQNEYNKAKCELLIRLHRCRDCGRQDAFTLNGRARCADCVEKNTEQHRIKYGWTARDPIEIENRKLEAEAKKWEHSAERRQSLWKDGICVRCTKRPVKQGVKSLGEPYKLCEDCYRHSIESLERAKKAYEEKYGSSWNERQRQWEHASEKQGAS